MVDDMQFVPVTSVVKMPLSIKYKDIQTSVKKPANKYDSNKKVCMEKNCC